MVYEYEKTEEESTVTEKMGRWIADHKGVIVTAGLCGVSFLLGMNCAANGADAILQDYMKSNPELEKELALAFFRQKIAQH